MEQYDVKKDDLIPYCKYAKKLLANFEAITLEHIPRKENRQADALANLATALALLQEETTKVSISQRFNLCIYYVIVCKNKISIF